MTHSSFYNNNNGSGIVSSSSMILLLLMNCLLLSMTMMIGGVTAQSTTATAVIGQPDFISASRDPFEAGVDPFGVKATAVRADKDGGLYVVDTGNHRVLYFPPGANNTSIAPIRVYGQPNMTSRQENRGRGSNPSADSLYGPRGIAIAFDGIYIADAANNRVLFYSGTSTTATRVYGQSSFTTAISGVSENKLTAPYGVSVDKDNNLYVADEYNNRVLFFPAGSTNATRVYGQYGSFTTTSAGIFPNANSLFRPTGVVASNNGVYIADSRSYRVLFYSGTSTTASIVYGHSDFVTGGAMRTQPSTHSFFFPYSVTLDNDCNLYVADNNNHRVLFFPVGSTNATRVYGQGGDFTTSWDNKDGISASSLAYPTDAAIGVNELFIVDSGNYRVLKYPLTDGSASSTSTGACARPATPTEATTTTTSPATTPAPPPTSSAPSNNRLSSASSLVIHSLFIAVSTFVIAVSTFL